MLKGDFYSLVSAVELNDSVVRCRIKFNSDHDIFNGHFPGLPVVPGVCMMAIVKETLEQVAGRTLQLQHSSTMKFLSLINPLENGEVTVEVKFSNNADNTITADASILGDNIVFFKISKAVYS